MEFLFEILFQFFAEIVLQLVLELLAELGMRSIAATWKKPGNPVLASIGFLLLGGLAGGASLLIFPASPISNPDLRRLNLILTPVAVGAIMMLLGKMRDRKGQDLVRLDRFGYAFLFAFAMALVRFIWAV